MGDRVCRSVGQPSEWTKQVNESVKHKPRSQNAATVNTNVYSVVMWSEMT